MTNLYRLLLILAAVVAGILNGSVLAAPVLIFMVYLLCVLVRLGREAQELYWHERYSANLNRIPGVSNASALAR